MEMFLHYCTTYSLPSANNGYIIPCFYTQAGQCTVSHYSPDARIILKQETQNATLANISAFSVDFSLHTLEICHIFTPCLLDLLT